MPPWPTDDRRVAETDTSSVLLPATMIPLPPPATRPVTARQDVTEVLHGVATVDPYRWLEEGTAPEVQAWMNGQDAYTRAILGALPGRDRLAARFRALYDIEAVGTPVVRSGRAFFLRARAGQEKAVLTMRDAAGVERVLVDPNAWTGDPVSLGSWVPSGDGTLLAYNRHPNQADEASLHVLDVETGVDLPDVIPGTKYAGVDWSRDGAGFFYEWLPSDPAIPVDQRPGHTEVRYHTLGTDPASDPLIHPRTGDPETFLSAALAADGRWLVVTTSRGWLATDVHLRDLSAPIPRFVPVVIGRPCIYRVTAWGDMLYILTNDGAARYHVYRAPAATPERARWTEIVPEDPKGTITSLTLVGGRVVLTYLVDVVGEIRLYTLDGAPAGVVVLPGVGSVSAVSGLPDADDGYFSWSSFTAPAEVHRLHVPTGRTDLWARVVVPIDPTPYLVEQVWYPSRDGTSIPMFLVRRKDAEKNGNNLTLLHGYGGFNISQGPAFRGAIYPWLEAGGIYAVANLRGGGELGEAWHHAGMLANKQNVFDDFIAAGEYLIREAWTRPARLGITGRSNGGLLVGAAVTQAPALWGAAVCGVPLLDMLRYHRFGSGRTWIPEYGSADDAEQFRYLSEWSPYQRIRRRTDYPAFLMDTNAKDDRVDPMHARKFAAALQDAAPPDRAVLFRCEPNAGHAGADAVSAEVERSADVYAFLLAALEEPR